MTLLDARFEYDLDEPTTTPPVRTYEVLAEVRLWVETPGLHAARQRVADVLRDRLLPVNEITSYAVEVVGVQPISLEGIG